MPILGSKPIRIFELSGGASGYKDHRPITGPVPNSKRWGRVAKGRVMVTNVHAMEASNDESQLHADRACTGGTITSPRDMK